MVDSIGYPFKICNVGIVVEEEVELSLQVLLLAGSPFPKEQNYFSPAEYLRIEEIYDTVVFLSSCINFVKVKV